ncbi:MAG: AarF/ABC1/UbiB kinase family protein [Desulfuromonadaceae bacterium]
MISLLRVNRNLRSIGRYREILSVLVGHGFGHIIEQLNIDYYLELGRRVISRDAKKKALERLPDEVRLRMALEELGPTFIKLGQLLSTRADIIPASYILELNNLQDKVGAVEWNQIRLQIEKELGGTIGEMFIYIDPNPVAAASMAQVHKAQLHSGEWVALKVRRPGIEKTIATDLDILENLASIIDTHGNMGNTFSAEEIVKEFRRTIYREMDFFKEGHNLCRFKSNFSSNERVHIPNVYWDWSTEALLSMELIEGTKISNIAALKQQGIDLKALAHEGAQAFMAQIIDHGMFHADPHPGNVFVLSDGRLCFLDLGMVGLIDDDLKQQLATLILSIFNKDSDELASLLISSRPGTRDIDKDTLKRDLTTFIEDYYHLPLKQIDSYRFITEFLTIIRSHKIKFPSDLILLAKSLITIEGIGRDLDPDFNLIEEVRPGVEKLIRKRHSTETLRRESKQILRDYYEITKALPGNLKELLSHITNNNFKIDLEHRGLERLIRTLHQSSNRISFSFLIGSLIIGSSLIVQTGAGPQLFGMPALGLFGYSIAAFLGLWLAIAIIGSGRL